MKSNAIKVLLILIFVSFLLFPKLVLDGATQGLLLWYQVVLPTLLPFLILTGLIIKTNAFDVITTLIGPVICKVFGTSMQGSFSIIIGFMCGYPMGAKAIHDLYLERNITRNEAQYLLSFCNNISPMFFTSFLIYQVFNDPNILIPSALAIYGAPILLSFVTRRIYLKKIDSTCRIPTSTINHRFSIKMLDDCIIDGFTLITKIGCYIMIFSIILNLASFIDTARLTTLDMLLPLLEITNGISMIEQMDTLFFHMKYRFIIFLVTFGGLCAIAQTQCVLEDTDIKTFPYFIQKIITAIIAVIIFILIY